MDSEKIYDATVMLGSLIGVVGAYLIVVRKDRCLINWATPTFILGIGTRYIFQSAFLYLIEPGGSEYAYTFCYATYALSALAGALTYSFLKPINLRFATKRRPSIARLPWILLLAAWLVYLPILIEFRQYLDDPRQIYILTRTGYGLWFFGSTMLATIAFVIYLFKPGRGAASTLLFLALCTALAYWHGSKGQILTYILIWMLYPIYVERRRISVYRTAGLAALVAALILGSFSLFTKVTDNRELFLEVINYADYVRNAMLVIDDTQADRYYGRLTIESELFTRIPRQLMPSKPKAFGAFRLAKAYSPAMYRKDEGAGAYDIGMLYADFGPGSLIVICLGSGFTGCAAASLVRLLRQQQSPTAFLLLLFFSSIPLVPIPGPWYLPETLLVAGMMSMALRLQPLRGAYGPRFHATACSIVTESAHP